MRGSIFAKVGRVASGNLRSRDCSSLSVKDASTKEEAGVLLQRAGLMMRAVCVKGILAYVAFNLGSSSFSPSDPVKPKVEMANKKKRSLERTEAQLNARLAILVTLGEALSGMNSD